MKSDNYQKLVDAIEERGKSGKELSVKGIADDCGLSHATIYNRYPELASLIKALQHFGSSAKVKILQQDLQAEREKNKQLVGKIQELYHHFTL